MQNTISLTKSEIIEKIPRLNFGNFWYWALKAGIKPIGEKRIDHNIAKLFPEESVKLIKQKMDESGGYK